jgi:dTMP kinase
VRGKFITFEGIEGCGKTTQINRLAASLKARGFGVVLSREPGGTAIGDRIRDILLDPRSVAMHPLTELLLYEASRRQHLEEIIIPALKKGEIFLCDRFSDSTIAYQGAARNIEAGIIKELDKIATGGFKPDLTLVLDLGPSEGLERARGRSEPDRFEREKTAFHEAVRNGYLELAKKEPARVKIVNGAQNIDDVEKEIAAIVDDLLKK